LGNSKGGPSTKDRKDGMVTHGKKKKGGGKKVTVKGRGPLIILERNKKKKKKQTTEGRGKGKEREAWYNGNCVGRSPAGKTWCSNELRTLGGKTPTKAGKGKQDLFWSGRELKKKKKKTNTYSPEKGGHERFTLRGTPVG